MASTTTTEIDATRFGAYGGRFAPEPLVEALHALEAAWKRWSADTGFQDELHELLAHHAGRPTALTHAARFGRLAGCDVWLKREDLLHGGAHVLNAALGQCLLAARAGKRRVVAAAGSGPSAVATATACALLGLECVVYAGDVERLRPSLARAELLGAEVVPVERAGRKAELDAALRAWIADPERVQLAMGTTLGPHPFPSIVADLQAVIGREARVQIEERAGGPPDVAVACVGGGSNAIGLFRAFAGDAQVELVGVEAGGEGVGTSRRNAARFAAGEPGVWFGSYTWLLQDDDGQVRASHSIAPGLDVPAVGPEHAMLHESKRARYAWATDAEAVRGLEALARSEGVVCALECAHAVGWVLRERERLAGKRVLVALSGRGEGLDALASRAAASEARA